MYSCWVPNRQKKNCELIPNLAEPVSGYCNSSPIMQKTCVNECIDHINYTLIQNCKDKMIHEKFCTIQDCLESCNMFRDTDAKRECLLFCDRSNFIKSSDYDYLYYCSDQDKKCSENCKKALRCRWYNYNPTQKCKLNICKNSCSFVNDPNTACNKIYGNYCSKYNTLDKTWKYNYRDASFSDDKCNRIDNELWLRTTDNKGDILCEKNTGHCKWVCDGNKNPTKKCHADPSKKCYETKSNCCQNKPKCMLR
jgi:hypothetical protein